MKILITSPINPISNAATSHRSAQAEIYAQQIYNELNRTESEPVEVVLNYGNKETDYDQYDRIYVYHGNDWGGTLNLFGGPDGISDKEGLVKLYRVPVEKIISLVVPMPDYAGMLRKRLKDGKKFGNILDELPEHTSEYYTTAISPSYEGGTNLVIGDSHAICLYRPGTDVLSVPFKTLYGALNQDGGFQKFVTERFLHPSMYSSFEFYFGNIDIRHHLMRQPKPSDAAIELASKYFDAVNDSFQNAEVSIYEPLPIENESRKLPKTGYYKGTPFYGSWQERNEVRRIFTDTLEQLCANSRVKLVRWTDYLKNDKGELDFKHMEKPRSVHLARASYPYWKGFTPDHQQPTGLESFFD